MKDLIRITESNGKRAVSARELHEFLGASERFKNWFNRQLQYGFIDGVDYVGCKEFNTLAKQDLEDFALSIGCAKEISMVQRSDKGQQARRYFISCEEKLKQVIVVAPLSDAITLIEGASRMLGLNDNSKLSLLHRAADIYNLDKKILPQYTPSKGTQLSASELLKRMDNPCSIHRFNSRMCEVGYLEYKERPSKSKGKKRFPSLTSEGEKYGSNEITPNGGSQQTQPLYYEDKFKALLRKIELI